MEGWMAESMEAVDYLRDYIVGEPDYENNVVKIALMIPLPNGDTIPARMALNRDGKIEAITTEGSYEAGVDALTQIIEVIKVEGVEIDEISFESHSHENQAPMQAYHG
tara:strand:+ start:353 stop:676 length:324 start_codon:yes stop_codon:yes gene_type:complete